MAAASEERTAAWASDADARARAVEEQLTDEERLSLLVSFMGHIPGSAVGGRDLASPRTSPT